MRFWLLTAVIACPLVGPSGIPSHEPAGKQQRFQIHLTVRAGDPLGDREEEFWTPNGERPEPGPAAILARTKLVTPEGVKASFRCREKDEPDEEWVDGNRLKLGYQVRLVPTQAAAGKIHLDATLSHTETRQREPGRLLVQSGQNHYKRTVSAGELCKLRWGSPSPGRQVWVEVKVRVVGP